METNNDQETIYVRHPRNGYIMACSPELAEVLVRKDRGFRIVRKPPTFDAKSLLKGGSK